MSRMLNAPKLRRRPHLPLKRWITRAEFEALMESGVFAPEDRLELIAGELVRREPVGTLHAVAVALANELLMRLLPETMHVRVQLPLALGDYDEPFPDIAIVSGRQRDYLDEHPTTALLVVEIAETSLRTDRETKGSLYAHAGIPEYWILNLKQRTLEVYREPAPDPKAVYGAAYQQRRTLKASDSIQPLFLPDASIAVASLMP
ncbi:MAG: Uma2 family endonuclease [Fimbriimonadales bacterium]|nr:Uma2 family endonuclease [Fimbriimonadales bacterium]